jgi:glycosyltransferase involved in cell wall biosynthesis
MTDLKHDINDKKRFPFVSVIMPIRNEEENIRNSLDAICKQNYPLDRLEILVVDGISTDNTRSIVQEIQQQYNQICLIDNPRKIVPPGLNLGIQQARGEIIIRVDGHTVISPDYVRECVEALARTGADNAGGKMVGQGKTGFGNAVVLATSSAFGIGNARFHFSNKEEWVDTVYLGAWPKKVFEKVGKFNEEMVRNQDDEFNYRLRKAGGKILLSPNIQSKYLVRGSPEKLWKQYFQYGYWKVRVLQQHPRQMSYRQFVPPLFVLALSSLSVLSIFVTSLRKLFGLIFGIYLAANLASSMVLAKKNGWKNLLFLPAVFLTLHLSYGSGFLKGLLVFRKKWK